MECSSTSIFLWKYPALPAIKWQFYMTPYCEVFAGVALAIAPARNVLSSRGRG